MRTITPAESWHECGGYSVRVIRRSHRRYLACVYAGEQREIGRTLIGDFPSPAAAVEAARLYLECTGKDTGERVCDWQDVETVRADRRRKGRQ